MFRLVRNTPFSIKNDILSGIFISFCTITLTILFCGLMGIDYRFGIVAYCICGLISFIFRTKEGMIYGPNLILSLFCYPLVAKFGVSYLFAATIVSGLLTLIFGFLRLGKYVRVLPRSVILGGISGVAVVIIINLALLIRRPNKDGFNFYIEPNELVSALAILIAFALILIYLPKYFKFIPAALSALIILVGMYFLFPENTESIMQFNERYANSEFKFSKINYLNLPDFSLETFRIIMPYSLFLFITGMLLSLNLLNFTDELTNTRGHSNRETLSLGLMNIISGLMGGVPIAGSLPLTMVGLNAGGKGRIAGFTSALITAGVVFWQPRILSYIPTFALIALIVILMAETFNRASFRQFKKIRVLSAFILVTVGVVTVLLDFSLAILIGIVVSFIVFAWENARRIRVRKRIDDTGVKYYEIYGPLFFGSIPVFKEKFEVENDPDEIVFDFYESRVLDYEGAKALFQIINMYHNSGKKVKLKFISSDLKRLIIKEKIDVEIIEGGEDDPTYTVLIDELS